MFLSNLYVMSFRYCCRLVSDSPMSLGSYSSAAGLLLVANIYILSLRTCLKGCSACAQDRLEMLRNCPRSNPRPDGTCYINSLIPSCWWVTSEACTAPFLSFFLGLRSSCPRCVLIDHAPFIGRPVLLSTPLW